MNSQLKDRLQEAGVDMEKTLGRFLNNEAMYEKFLRRFLQDQSFPTLEHAVAQNDIEEIERSAHTLKGVSANLGLDPIAAILGEMVCAVRAGNTDGLGELFAGAKEQYNVFVQVISQYSE